MDKLGIEPTGSTKEDKGWADEFCGKWKDDSLSAEEQVAFIRES